MILVSKKGLDLDQRGKETTALSTDADTFDLDPRQRGKALTVTPAVSSLAKFAAVVKGRRRMAGRGVEDRVVMAAPSCRVSSVWIPVGVATVSKLLMFQNLQGTGRLETPVTKA